MQQDKEKVDDNIINFRPLVSLVLNYQFIQTLPDTFKSNDNNDGNKLNLPPHSPKKRKLITKKNLASIKIQGHYQIALYPKKIQKCFVGKHLDA